MSEEHAEPFRDAGIRMLDREPWVDIPDAKAFGSWSHQREIVYNQNVRQAEKLRFFQLTFDFLKENGIGGDYFEFGCHRVRTFRMALSEARRHDLGGMRFLAFDSFAGLPESAAEHGVENWKTGALCTKEDEFQAIVAAHGVYADRVRSFKGFYSDTLTPALRDSLQAAGHVAGLVTVECDFYESAVPVFDFIEPFLTEGSVIYIDDYFAGYRGSPHKGVARAFAEFARRSRFRYVQHLQVGWSGRSFIAYAPDPALDAPAPAA